MSEENLKTIEEKIDSLINGRKRERLLSKTDGLYNLFITISTFIVGIFVSQRDFIAPNVIVSFFLIGVILSMIGSFIIGFRGMIRDTIRDRLLAYCLLISTPMCYVSMPIMLILSVYIAPLTPIELNAIAIIIVILLAVFTALLSNWFIKKFQKDFPFLFEQETINRRRIIIDTVYGVSVMFVLTFFVTLAVFFIFLPILL
jgi:uncharacterized membrane protein